MKISQKHPNRQPHNWLIYDVNDQWLESIFICMRAPFMTLDAANHHTGNGS